MISYYVRISVNVVRMFYKSVRMIIKSVKMTTIDLAICNREDMIPLNLSFILANCKFIHLILPIEQFYLPIAKINSKKTVQMPVARRFGQFFSTNRSD